MSVFAENEIIFSKFTSFSLSRDLGLLGALSMSLRTYVPLFLGTVEQFEKIKATEAVNIPVSEYSSEYIFHELNEIYISEDCESFFGMIRFPCF